MSPKDLSQSAKAHSPPERTRSTSASARPEQKPSRIVHCEDAIRWLKEAAPQDAQSIITSLPDVSGLPHLSFEEWQELKPTLLPLIKEEVSEVFLPWVNANNDAVKNNKDQLSIILKGRPFTHKVTSVQKFHAKSFGLLMEHYKTVSQDQELREILVETGVKEYLNA